MIQMKGLFATFVKPFFMEAAGVATGFASVLPSLLNQDDAPEGDSVLDYMIRALIAALRIISKLPKKEGGGIPTISELIIEKWGSDFGNKIEGGLRSITNVPQIFDLLQGIIAWVYVVLVVAMLIGISIYWRAYTIQSQGGDERIWKNKILLLNPLDWFLRRLFPYCIFLASPLFVLSKMTELVWATINFVIRYGYEASGTTFGGSIEEFLFTISEKGGLGAWGIYFCMLMMIPILGWTAYKFALRLLKFIIANFVCSFNLGLWLDGSRMRTVARPLGQWMRSLLELGGMVVLLFAIPLVIGPLPELWAMFFMLLLPLFAAQYTEWISHWFGESQLGIGFQRIVNPSWIDNIEQRPARGQEPVDIQVGDVTGAVGGRLKGAGQTIVGMADQVATVASPKYRAAKTAYGAAKSAVGLNGPPSVAHKRGQQWVNQAVQAGQQIKDVGASFDPDLQLIEGLQALNWVMPGKLRSMKDHAILVLIARLVKERKLTGTCTQCGYPLKPEGIVCEACGTPNVTYERAQQIAEDQYNRLSAEQQRELTIKGNQMKMKLSQGMSRGRRMSGPGSRGW